MNANIIKHQRVILRGSGSKANDRSNGARTEAACASKKNVRLVEHESVVRGIEIICSCGERTLIELVFDPAPARAASAEEKST